MKRPKVGGLCSGVGGIELGFKQAGFDIAWANEMDEKACITYRHIHKIELNDYLIHSTLEELLAEIKSKPLKRLAVCGCFNSRFRVSFRCRYRKGLLMKRKCILRL